MFPYRHFRVSMKMPPFRNFEFQVYAQRLGTAVTLSVDCIVLIPSKYSFKITNTYLDDNPASEVDIFINEDTTVSCVNIAGVGYRLGSQVAVNNLVYPNYGGKLVVAGQEAASQQILDVFDVLVDYYERFRVHGQ